MRYLYQVNAYYWGNASSVEHAVEGIDFAYDDLDWSPDDKKWSWYLDCTVDVDQLYMQLKSLGCLTVDVLRYEQAPVSLH